MTAITVYCILVIIALFPLIGLPPFTLLFSKHTQPRTVQLTSKFKKTNNLLSYCWATIFAICAVLVWIIPKETPWHIIAPTIIILTVGGGATFAGIHLLPQYIAEKRPFVSCAELFELMPHGICRRYAKKLNPQAIVQFKLSGAEPINGYLTLNGTKCSFTNGESLTPTVTIKCNSQLWLDISNGNADAIKESVEGNYTTEGNSSILLHLGRLFRTGWKVEPPFHVSIPKNLYQEYAALRPVKIHKVVIFYSGKRSKAFSKTLFMTDHLAQGIADEGGQVEVITLGNKQIAPCTGCYTCWTKTPGKCIFNDDMPELINKYLDADLIVFASPLYTFTVNGVMKMFMDRLIPILKPYMEYAPDGRICHPQRYENKAPTHIMAVSAGGFPNIEGNFDGLRELFRQSAWHSQRGTLRGELLLPAAETIAIPLFENRKNEVADACNAIGHELIRNGCPSVENMRKISNTGITEQEFRHMANVFWAKLDHKKAYMSAMEQLKNE